MSFFQIEVNPFIETLYNLSMYCIISLLFGFAINTEYYQEKIKVLKLQIKLNRALEQLQNIEVF